MEARQLRTALFRTASRSISLPTTWILQRQVLNVSSVEPVDTKYSFSVHHISLLFSGSSSRWLDLLVLVELTAWLVNQSLWSNTRAEPAISAYMQSASRLITQVHINKPLRLLPTPKTMLPSWFYDSAAVTILWDSASTAVALEHYSE